MYNNDAKLVTPSVRPSILIPQQQRGGVVNSMDLQDESAERAQLAEKHPPDDDS